MEIINIPQDKYRVNDGRYDVIVEEHNLQLLFKPSEDVISVSLDKPLLLNVETERHLAVKVDETLKESLVIHHTPDNQLQIVVDIPSLQQIDDIEPVKRDVIYLDRVNVLYTVEYPDDNDHDTDDYRLQQAMRQELSTWNFPED